MEKSLLTWENPVIGPTQFTIDAMFNALAKQIPGKIAVREGEQEYTFADLNNESKRIAGIISRYGITTGQIIVLDLPVGIQLLLALLGISRMGVIALHLHDLLRPEEVASIIRLMKPVACIGRNFHQLALSTLELNSLTNYSDQDMTQPPTPENIALIRTSSGTTGSPKLIAVSHAQLCRRLRSPGRHYSFDHVYGCSLPHMFPSYQIITALGAGGTVVFRPAVTLNKIERFIFEEKITCFWGIPAFYDQMTNENIPSASNLPSLKFVVSSGSYLSSQTIATVIKRWQVPLIQFYGQSELGFYTESTADTPSGSVGRPVPGVTIRIIDLEGHHLNSGQIGRVQVQAGVSFGGYLSGENAPIDGEGWFMTGDLGYLDSEGNLFLTGRENLLIHVGGFKVSPEEVAAIIDQIPGIQETFVFGEVHPIRGEIVVAAVVASDLNEKSIRNYCRKLLPRYKCPFKVYFLSELPRNALGKVSLPMLRELIAKL